MWLLQIAFLPVTNAFVSPILQTVPSIGYNDRVYHHPGNNHNFVIANRLFQNDNQHNNGSRLTTINHYYGVDDTRLLTVMKRRILPFREYSHALRNKNVINSSTLLLASKDNNEDKNDDEQKQGTDNSSSSNNNKDTSSNPVLQNQTTTNNNATITTINLSKYTQKAKQFLQRNIFNSPKDKEFGTSGELFIFLELALFLCILRGEIPLLQHLIDFLFGPVLFLSGIIVSALGIRELNTTSFTALADPIPVKRGGKMVTSGVYSYVRHPVYAGNLGCFVGLSIMTHSSMRLLLSLLYYIVVELKSRQEEVNMGKEFGGNVYRDYRGRVKGKFFPSRDLLVEWTKSKVSRFQDEQDDDDDDESTRGYLFP